MLYLDFPFPLDLAADKLTKERRGGKAICRASEPWPCEMQVGQYVRAAKPKTHRLEPGECRVFVLCAARRTFVSGSSRAGMGALSMGPYMDAGREGQRGYWRRREMVQDCERGSHIYSYDSTFRTLHSQHVPHQLPPRPRFPRHRLRARSSITRLVPVLL